MNIELLKIALEALESCYNITDYPGYGDNEQSRAIDALKTEIAKHECTIKNKLLADIMNMQCNPPLDANINQRIAFKQGHKQFRHQIAELIRNQEIL